MSAGPGETRAKAETAARTRVVAKDEVRLLELEHPGLAPVVSVERAKEGGLQATWEEPEVSLPARLDRATGVRVAADLLVALEFLANCGWVLEDLRSSDIKLDGSGRPLLAPLALGLRPRENRLPYGKLFRELLSDEATSALEVDSFGGWLSQIARISMRPSLRVSPRLTLGRRPRGDRSLREILKSGGRQAPCGSFALDGEPRCGRSAFLRRVFMGLGAGPCRIAVVRGRSDMRASGFGLAAILTALGERGKGGARKLMELIRRQASQGLAILVDDACHLDAASAEALQELASEEGGISVGVASTGREPLPEPLLGLPRLMLGRLDAAEAGSCFWLQGSTPGSRRRAAVIFERAWDACEGQVEKLHQALAAACEGRGEIGATRTAEELEQLRGRLRLALDGRGDGALGPLVADLDVSLSLSAPPAARQFLGEGLGDALTTMGRIPEAVEAFEEAIAANGASCGPELRLKLARAQVGAMAYEEALETLTRLPFGLPASVAAQRANLRAEIHWKRGDVERASEAVEAGLAAVSEPDLAAQLMSLKASIAAEAGDDARSTRLFEEALAIEGVGPRSRARVLQRRGRAEKLLGRRARALDLYAEAERAFREGGDGGAAAGCRVDMGNCMRYMGDVDGALSAYGEALAAAEAIGDQETAVLARFNRDTLRAERGDWRETYEALLAATRMEEQLGLRSYLAMGRSWLGIVAMWMGESHSARRDLEAAERDLRAQGESRNADEVALHKAELHLREGELHACGEALARVADRSLDEDELSARKAALAALREAEISGKAPVDLVLSLRTWWSAKAPAEVASTALVALALASAMGGKDAEMVLRDGLARIGEGGHLFYETCLLVRLLRLRPELPAEDSALQARLERVGLALERSGASHLRHELATRGRDEGSPQVEEAALLQAYRIAEVLVEEADPAFSCSRLVAEMIKVTRSASGCLYLPRPSGGLMLAASSGEASRSEAADVAAEAARAGKPRLVEGMRWLSGGSAIAAPLALRGELLGVLYLERTGPSAPYAESHERLLKAFGDHAGAFLAPARRLLLASTAAAAESDEILPGVIGRSEALRSLAVRARMAAEKDVPVLIRGESGTGKEVFARAIHRLSLRRERRFLPINMGALPESLAPAELSGARRGAYSGAVVDRPGLVEEAHGGTLFLDEVGDMHPPTQVALLRILQEGEVRRLGETQPRRVDVRFLFATHKDLEAGIKAGWFREDLFYRINVISLTIPPLRERPEDIAPLAAHLCSRIARRLGMGESLLTSAAMTVLSSYAWPGNVRQLENVLTRTLVDLHGDEISPKDLPAEIRVHPVSGEPGTLKAATARFERDYLAGVLRRCRGNRTQAAKVLGLTRQGLIGKLKALGLSGEAKEGAGA